MVYPLQSDDKFIRATVDQRGNDIICVYKYNPGVGGSQNFSVEMPINAPLYTWELLTSIGRNSSYYEKLAVHGVEIPIQWMSSLAGDLTPAGKDGQKFHLMVNRQGLCLLDISGDTGPMKWLRINDRFGWSKYGVRVPRDGLVTWSMCDMHNGTVLVDGRNREEENRGHGLSSSQYYLEAP